MDQVNGDQILDECVAEPVMPPDEAARAVRAPRVRWRHEALIDLMIAHPEQDQNDWARTLGYTASWLSTIIASDSFQAALEERKDEIVDPQLKATVQEQLKGVLARSLEILRKKLDGPADQVEAQLALRTIELSSRALGYGARDAQPTAQVHTHLHIESLGDNLVAVLRKKKQEVLEGEVVNGEPQAS